ncbi:MULTISPECIES: hypothetical protein [Blautia]|uniref:Uncharacterized protein n=1 Tax=Blautia obeum TaxID=40520 RepID=A0A414JC88_9FIRM|nr:MULTISPECIES: hypothetical protein [Blautia]RHA47198.1 hypothetical protein DW934_10720 [Blautia obeum]RHE42165.1 hypothetical protein DW740_02360 [Blautia obeum]
MKNRAEKAGGHVKKKRKMLVGILAALLCMATGAYGYFSDSLEIKNHITMGDIRINMTEFARKGNGEVKYRDPAYIFPGERISKIPRIKNRALPCWIRAHISYGSDKDDMEMLSEHNIEGISSEWIKRGDYYYYTKVLKKQESVDLFQSVSVPAVWTEEHGGQKLSVTVQADAIQAANFKPDFTAMSPWGNQEIQDCVHETNGTMTCKKGERKLSVEFQGKAHKLIAVPDDFFANLETAMPGDILTDTVKISNTTKNDAEIFFRISTEGRTKEKLDMLKNICFQIAMGEKVLYTGTLDAAKLQKNHSLGVFKSKASGELKFLLEIPKEWDNAWALKKTDVSWIFTVQDETSGMNQTEEQKQNGAQSLSGDSAQAFVKDTGSRQKSSVKTGDSMPVELMLLLLMAAGISIPVIKKWKGAKKP